MADAKKNPFMRTPIPGTTPAVHARVQTYNLPVNADTAMHVPPVDTDWEMSNRVMAPLILCLDADMNVLLTGDAGTGKTTVIQQMCALRNYPFTRISMSEGVKESDLFGRYVARAQERGVETVWLAGPVQVAVEQGHVLLIDEIDFADPSHLVALRGLLEPQHRLLRLLGKDGQVVRPHAQFRVTATANSIGNANRSNYMGANIMNLADIDRFDCTITVGHLEPEKEVALVRKKCPAVPQDVAENMVAVANLVRKGNSEAQTMYPFGLRAVLKWARQYVLFEHVGIALQQSVLDTLEAHEATYVREIYTSKFGKH